MEVTDRRSRGVRYENHCRIGRGVERRGAEGEEVKEEERILRSPSEEAANAGVQ